MINAHEEQYKSTEPVMIGRRVKSRRVLRNWTQVQLAEVAGVSSATVAYVEQGRVDTTVGTLTKLAGALGVSLDALVYGDEPAARAA